MIAGATAAAATSIVTAPYYAGVAAVDAGGKALDYAKDNLTVNPARSTGTGPSSLGNGSETNRREASKSSSLGRAAQFNGHLASCCLWPLSPFGRSRLVRDLFFLVESRCGAVALGRTYLLPPLSSWRCLRVCPERSCWIA